jgi:hypothetical protein
LRLQRTRLLFTITAALWVLPLYGIAQEQDATTTKQSTQQSQTAPTGRDTETVSQSQPDTAKDLAWTKNFLKPPQDASSTSPESPASSKHPDFGERPLPPSPDPKSSATSTTSKTNTYLQSPSLVVPPMPTPQPHPPTALAETPILDSHKTLGLGQIAAAEAQGTVLGVLLAYTAILFPFRNLFTRRINGDTIRPLFGNILFSGSDVTKRVRRIDFHYAIKRGFISKDEYDTLRNTYLAQSELSFGLLVPMLLGILYCGLTRVAFTQWWILMAATVFTTLLAFTSLERRHKYFSELRTAITQGKTIAMTSAWAADAESTAGETFANPIDPESVEGTEE